MLRTSLSAISIIALLSLQSPAFAQGMSAAEGLAAGTAAGAAAAAGAKEYTQKYIQRTKPNPNEYNPIGKPAPDFSAETAEGNTVKLSDFSGKIIVLEWHNPECPYDQKHYDSNNMQQLQAFARSEGIVWLTINSTFKSKRGYMEPREAWAYIDKNKSRANHYLIDPKSGIGMAYNAKATPSVAIIDAGGNVAYTGAIDDKPTDDVKDIATARNYVRNSLNNLLLGMPAVPSATEPYGCPVKYELVPD